MLEQIRNKSQCWNKYSNCWKFSEQAWVAASQRGLTGFLLEFGLCRTGFMGSQSQAFVMISHGEGVVGKSGLVGIPGGKIHSTFPYHSLKSVWQCREQLTMGRSSSDKQGCKIHGQGMRAGEALPGTAATWTPRLAGNQGDMLKPGASVANGNVTAA